MVSQLACGLSFRLPTRYCESFRVSAIPGRVLHIAGRVPRNMAEGCEGEGKLFARFDFLYRSTVHPVAVDLGSKVFSSTARVFVFLGAEFGSYEYELF